MTVAADVGVNTRRTVVHRRAAVETRLTGVTGCTIERLGIDTTDTAMTGSTIIGSVTRRRMMELRYGRIIHEIDMTYFTIGFNR